MKLHESTVFEAIPSDRIDLDSGIVRGVRILGAVSRNNRRYTEAAMRQAAALYEGRGVKLNHPDRQTPNKDRSVTEGFGELRNARVERDAVYADHYFPKSHKYASTYAENCQRFSKQLGFSHNAEGEYKLDGDTQIVESISEVYSVDLVDSPATNKGIFESTQPKKRRRKRRLAGVLEASPDSTQSVRTLLMEQMDAGVIAPDLMVDGPIEGETQDGAIKAAFRAAVIAVFDDPSLDADATKKAIAKIIDTAESIGQPDETEETDFQDEDSEMPMKTDKAPEKAPPEKDKKAFESLQAELTDLKNENAIRKLLESSTVEIDDKLIETLKPLTEEQRTWLIERLATDNDEPRAERPERSAPLREAVGESKWSKAIAKATA